MSCAPPLAHWQMAHSLRYKILVDTFPATRHRCEVAPLAALAKWIEVIGARTMHASSLRSGAARKTRLHAKPCPSSSTCNRFRVTGTACPSAHPVSF
eukprot:585198-Amphidinium_carterae.1